MCSMCRGRIETVLQLLDNLGKTGRIIQQPGHVCSRHFFNLFITAALKEHLETVNVEQAFSGFPHTQAKAYNILANRHAAG